MGARTRLIHNLSVFLDTRHFWDVTENLYRFIPASVGTSNNPVLESTARFPDLLMSSVFSGTAEFKNPHTVDERVSVRAHVTTIRFFYELIRNMEGWRQGDEKA
jgi:Gly-Xaa carboxypeptidase